MTVELNKISSGSWFRIVSGNVNPPGAPDPGDQELQLVNIDGMYSYCVNREGEVFHPVVWAQVDKLRFEPLTGERKMMSDFLDDRDE